MNNTSHIVIDLSDSAGLAALRQLSTMDIRRGVKSAVIFGKDTSHRLLESSLHFLGKFPRLTRLTLDLEGQTLSVSSLAIVLSYIKRLQCLTVRNLALAPGKEKEWKKLDQSLSSSKLQMLSLHSTPQVVAAQALVDKLRVSRKEHPRGCNQYAFLLKKLLGIQGLRALSLVNILDEPEEAKTLADLVRRNNLQKLRIQSSRLGGTAGELLVNALRQNTSITDLTLRLEGEWDSSGASMAKLVSCSTTLRKLHLRLVDNDFDCLNVKRSAVQIAKSLASNTSTLTHMWLEVDLLSMKLLKQDSGVVHAFESVLETNHTLGELKIVDPDEDHVVKEHSLSPNIHMRLALNHSGLGLLLQNKDHSSQFMVSYVEAMARAKGDINVLFTALLSNPGLFCY